MAGGFTVTNTRSTPKTKLSYVLNPLNRIPVRDDIHTQKIKASNEKYSEMMKQLIEWRKKSEIDSEMKRNSVIMGVHLAKEKDLEKTADANTKKQKIIGWNEHIRMFSSRVNYFLDIKIWANELPSVAVERNYILLQKVHEKICRLYYEGKYLDCINLYIDFINYTKDKNKSRLMEKLGLQSLEFCRILSIYENQQAYAFLYGKVTDMIRESKLMYLAEKKIRFIDSLSGPSFAIDPHEDLFYLISNYEDVEKSKYATDPYADDYYLISEYSEK